MRILIPSLILSAALSAPAFAAHGGGGGGAMHGGPSAPNHGMAVSQAAHTAHGSGAKVGPQVSTVARSGATASRVGTTNTTSKAVTPRGTGSNTHSNHGATVSQTAHSAKASGAKVGPQVRTVARSNAHGKGVGASKTNHGATVSQTAHSAKANGGKVGPQVRTVARSKSQGATHANSHALSQTNTHARSGSNSVLGNRSVGH